jgi:hypothetical protein
VGVGVRVRGRKGCEIGGFIDGSLIVTECMIGRGVRLDRAVELDGW